MILKLTIINFVKKILSAGSLFFYIFNNAYALSPWQGEWGIWSKPPENFQNYSPQGGSISIYNCNEDLCTFALHVSVDTQEKGKAVSNFGNWKGQFHILSATLAEGKVNNTNCQFQFAMNNNSSIRVIKHQGEGCCKSMVGSFPSQVIYRLRTHNNYEQGNVDYDCYSDSSVARQIWCTDQQLQALNTKLSTLVDYLDEHQREYSSEKNGITPWLKNTLQQCETNKNPQTCIFQAYTQKIAAFELMEKQRKNDDVLAHKNLFLPGNAAQASKVIDNIQGVYKHKVTGSYMSERGGTFEEEDILEIVRVTDDSIYFKTILFFGNGHTGSIFGMAHYKKDGLFLFADNVNPEQGCLLRIIPTPSGIIFKTNHGCSGYHGARGMLDGTEFAFKERRPIRYMKLLTNSEDYKKSIANIPEKLT